MQKRPVSFYLGNFFLVLAFIGFAVIFAPVIQLYVFPPSTSAEQLSKEFSIWIPRIKAAGNIHKNIDPWNEKGYKEALKTGIAHAKDTSLPGQDGTVFLFAHSSGMPWELTRYNTVFLRLGELKAGDMIQVFYEGKTYNYKVRGKKEVSPTEVKYLSETKAQLILQTCSPIGTDWRRLLILADPVMEQ